MNSQYYIKLRLKHYLTIGAINCVFNLSKNIINHQLIKQSIINIVINNNL